MDCIEVTLTAEVRVLLGQTCQRFHKAGQNMVGKNYSLDNKSGRNVQERARLRWEEYVGKTKRLIVMDVPGKRRKRWQNQMWMDSINHDLTEKRLSEEAYDWAARRWLIRNIDRYKSMKRCGWRRLNGHWKPLKANNNAHFARHSLEKSNIACGKYWHLFLRCATCHLRFGI